MNVLIVIEEPKFRQALDSFLRSQSVSPVTVSSLDEARYSGIATPVNLIFASETLADLDPAATLALVRSLPGAEQARVVAVSASRTPALKSLYEAGFDGVVGPGSSADEIAVQAILAGRFRPDAGAPNENAVREQSSEAVATGSPPAFSDRGRDVLATLKTLGFYLARQAPAERQAQHALRAVDILMPGVAAAVLLRPTDRRGWVLVPGTDLPPSFPEVAFTCYADLTDDEWESFAGESRFVSREHSDSGSFEALVSSDMFSSALHIGLTSSERTRGILAIYSVSKDEMDPHDIMALETIASMTAVAMAQGDSAAQTAEAIDEQAEPTPVEPVSPPLPWEQVFERFPIAAFLIDDNGFFVATNEALSTLTGFSADSMRTLSVFDVIADDVIDTIGETLGQLVSDESTGPVYLPVGVKSSEENILSLTLSMRAIAPEERNGTAIIQGVLREASHDARESARLESLQDIARIVATERDVDQAASGVLAALSQRLGYPKGAIWVSNSEGTTLQCRAALTEDVPESLSIDDGIAGRVFRSSEPEIANNHDLSDPQGAGDIVCVPIVHAQRIFGVLQIESGSSNPLSEDDLNFFVPIAAQIAGIIERDMLYQHLQRQAMTDQVTGLPNRQVFQERLDEAVASLTAGAVSVLVLGVDGFKQVNELYGHSIGDDVLRQIGAELQRRMTSDILLARYTSDQFVVLLPTAYRDEAVSIAEDLRIGLATHLFTVAEQVEQLTVSIGAATCPDDAETSRSLLQAADHAMYLAKRAGRNQTFQSNAAFATLAPAHGRINDLLRQSPRETLSLLIRAMDQRLPERAGHSERVTRYALAIARELGLSDAELPRLRLAAYIHDIGMVSLPDSLLRKPSQLSAEERSLLRGVPVAAHGLLSQLDLSESVLLSVLHQRENYDGTGYPSGLRGDGIPLGARIIAVADALDAMTSVRAHRQPMTLDQALDQVSQQAGLQFDPDVARAAHCLTDVISEPVSIPIRDENGRETEGTPVLSGFSDEYRD